MRLRAPIRRFLPLFAAAAALLLPQGAGLNLQADTPPAFTDVTAARGLEFVILPELREDWGSGAAWGDFDGDGDLDLYVAMGHNQENRLYRSDNAVMFYDEAADLGCADPRKSKGVKFADYDNDGDQDLFVSNLDAGNRLYRNDDGYFTEVTAAAGMTYAGKSYGAAWGDYNNDGWLDLYVCTRAQSNNLFYHNNGDGTFTNRTVEAGTQVPDRLSFEVVWTDYDLDGLQDIYIAVDKRRGNVMLHNNGDGTFTDVSAATRTDVEIDGMGIAVGDYDNDGDEDLYITHTNPGHVLLKNNGDGTFTDDADFAQVRAFRYGWGTEFLDYDNDADLDLYVVHWTVTPGQLAAENMLFRNNSNGTFTNVAAEAGVNDAGAGHGLAVGDYNNDGFIDLFVVNQDGPSKLFENTPAGGSWLKVHPIGNQSNRDGIGARIRVQFGSTQQWRVIHAGSSYLSTSGRDAHFGVGSARNIDVVEVTWPSGIVDTFEDVTPNQTLVVCEGEPCPEPPIPDVPPNYEQALYQNYPNPFNPQTTISFTVDEAGPVKLTVLDALGRVVDILVNEEMSAGDKEIEWTPDDTGNRLASGVYFYRLETRTGSYTRKMLLVK